LFCCSGLKFINLNGQIKRPFIKIRPILLDEKGQFDISIVFIEEMSHFINGDHYWMRVQSPNHTLVHIQQKGKKKFKELLSEREIEILKLVIEKKRTKEIAMLLNLSKLTIETHRKNMLKRTGVLDITALIHICKNANII